MEADNPVVNPTPKVLPVEGFSTVDSWATTIPDYHRAIFHWRIKNYELLSNKGKERILSPEYEETSTVDGVTHQRRWQIQLSPDSRPEAESYVSAHLYLVGCKIITPKGVENVPETSKEILIRANFTISLVDEQDKALRSGSGTQNGTHEFRLRSGWGFSYFLNVNALLRDKSKYLPNGDMLVRCTIWYRGRNCKHNYRQGCGGAYYNKAVKRKAPADRAYEDYGNLWRSGMLSDIVVEAGPSKTRYSAHKVVLAAKSEVFLTMLTSPLKTQEAQMGVITIPDFEDSIVRVMLEYMYTNTLKPTVLNSCSFDLFCIANKYSVKELFELCEVELIRNISVKTCLELLVASDMHNSALLKEACLQFVDGHRSAVEKQPSFKKVSKDYPYIFRDLYEAKK